MKFLRHFFALNLLLLATLFVGPQTAGAEEDVPLLEVSDVAAFLNVWELFKPIDLEFRETGEPSIFRPKADLIGKAGLPAFQENMNIVKNGYPGFYKRFSDAAVNYRYEDDDDDQRYKSMEDWTKMGDRIMLAFYARDAKSTDPREDDFSERMAVIPEFVLNIKGGEVRNMINDAQAMLHSYDNVPQRDKEVVRLFEKQFALHLLEFSGNYPASSKDKEKGVVPKMGGTSIEAIKQKALKDAMMKMNAAKKAHGH